MTSIGANAFFGCSSLTSITIPNSAITIGEAAFHGCSSLSSAIIGNNVTNIGEATFAWCTDLTSITIGNSVTDIGNSAFYYCTNLTSITIPDGVTGIGNNAFEGCEALISVDIPESVTNIGEGAFLDCSSLTSVSIPKDVTIINDRVFAGCNDLTSINIPNNVTSIGFYAFGECLNLTSITIPNNVTNIGNYAFAGSGLISIIIPESVTSIGVGAFRDCSSSLTSVKVEVGNIHYDSRNDCNAIIETESNELILGCQNTIIPSGVASIGNYAFSYCWNLTSITVPEGVTSIGNYAFLYCDDLNSITIPSSMASIGNYAFKNCYNLTSVVSKVVEPFSFGEDAFVEIPSNCVLTVPIGTKDAYIAAGWTEEVFRGGIIEDGMEMSISSVGYATFFNIYGDLVIPEGVTAYIATVYNGSVSLDKIKGKIPVNTPVVLKGAAGTYDISYTTGATAIATNNLKIATAPVTSDGTQYVLANRTSHGVGFYKVKAGTTIPAGKVYLQLPSSGIKDFFGFDEDDATGIETLSNSPLKDESIYNLAGQRINKMQRGINIINGKKVLK